MANVIRQENKRHNYKLLTRGTLQIYGVSLAENVGMYVSVYNANAKTK